MSNLRIGLNPYGLTYHLGLFGQGTTRANPAPAGLEGLLAIAAEVKAKTLELHDPWLGAMSQPELAALSERISGLGMTPVISAGFNLSGLVDSALRSAKALNARTIRLALTPVIEGTRAAHGQKWFEMIAAARAGLAKYAPMAKDQGVSLAIENHQDFGSQELVEFCEEAGESVGICLDTGNVFAVAEAPLDFARRVAPLVRHVHLKDYRVQMTDEGYRLARCAIGEGAVPFAAIAEVLARHHPSLTAALEPGALEARHVRFLKPGWWHGYAPVTAKSFAAVLAAARVNRIGDMSDYRTPWERRDDKSLVSYELDMIRRSAATMRKLGLMEKEPEAETA